MADSKADTIRIANKLSDLYQKGLIKLEKVSVELPDRTWKEISMVHYLSLVSKNQFPYKRVSFSFVEVQKSKQ